MLRTAILVAALGSVAGCGLGDRQHDADAIVDGTKAAFAHRTARGTLAVSFQIKSVPDALGSIGGMNVGGEEGAQALVGGQGPPPVVAEFAFDFDDETASLTMPGEPRPFALFDGLDSYGWRYTANDRDARPWVFLDLEDLEEGSSELSMTEDSPFIGGFALNPIVLFDLAAGPLAGSIEEVATEEVAGASTVRYDANFDIDKVLRKTRRTRYDEDRRDAIDETLRALTVKGRTHSGQVWLDDEGLPRRFTIRLREEPVKRFKVDLIIDFTVHEFDGDTTVEIPTPRELVEVDNVVQFLRSMIPSPTTPEFFEFIGVEPQAPPTPQPPPGTTSTTTPTETTAPTATTPGAGG